jgi:aspartyl protease family protein
MLKPLVFMMAIGAAIGMMLPGKPKPVPARAAVASATPGSFETLIERSDNGHFYVDATINDQLVHFVVDTGATGVALTTRDAERLGIPFSPGEFTVVGTGASGPVRGRLITLDSVSVGGKKVSEVRGAVIEGLQVSLLGQSYLSRINSVEMAGDHMRLR